MSITEQTIQEAATPGEAAAMWWAQVLQDPKLDNGDDNPMTAVLAALTKESTPSQPTDRLEKFKELLIIKLNERVTEYGLSFGVDYHPDIILLECAEAAGLQTGLTDWPWKTHMWVSQTKVSVSYGYGAEAQVIWNR